MATNDYHSPYRQHYAYSHTYASEFNTSNHSGSPLAPVSPLLPAQRLPKLQTGDRDVRNDLTYSLVSPMMSRSPSIASDSRFSAFSGTTGPLPASPANIRPAAAYIAPQGAVQVVTESQANGNREADSDEDELQLRASKNDIAFTPASLALINAFLDQLLYSILSTAKSTKLSALRSASTEILKNKLARDAIASADEELRDLLSGNDEDEDKDGGAETDSRWDLELVWKRTRLRVMVYMRLGEMEDEDEERYVKEQGLRINGEHSRFSSTAGLVSWSAAIFLTSVLEHVAEQTLHGAGSAAFSRARRRGPTSEDRAGAPAIIVEEQDAERIAVNPALGRLWRSWRKTVRSTTRPVTPEPAREIASVISPPKSLSSPRDSFGTAPESAHEDENARLDRLANNPPDTQHPEHILASNIRLPMGDPLRDVDEIEVPGLARDPSEAGSDNGMATSEPTERRKSFSTYQTRRSENVVGSYAQAAEYAYQSPKAQHRRSSSVPTIFRRSVLTTQTPDATQPTLAEVDPNRPDFDRPSNKAEGATLAEDVDKRKSLIDIKTLLAAIDGGFASYGASGTRLETVKDRPSSSDSARSFKLHDGVQSQPLAERQHMQPADTAQIGIATTSDAIVAPERVSSAPGTRGTPSPIPNLSRATSTPRSKYSPQSKEDNQQDESTPATQSVSQRDRPVEPSEKTLAVLRDSVQRASSPQTVSQAPNGSPSAAAKRQSLVEQYGAVSAFSNQAQYWQSKQSPPAVEEHPLAVEEHAPAATNGLTSSSIRSPNDFDEFVQSEDMIEHTPTPDPTREAPNSDAQALAQLTGETPPVVVPTVNKDESDKRASRGAVKSTSAADVEKKKRWSITRPLSRNLSAHKKSGLMARDARVVTESTRDFADFIRSTKPDKEPEILPFVTNQSSAASLRSLRNSTNYSLPRSQSLTSDRTRSLTKLDIDAGHAPPVPSLPKKGQPVLQPRSPKADEKSGNNELIALMRAGPKQEGQQRTTPSIAPSRSTMNSEQFNEFKTSHPVQPLTSSNSRSSLQPSNRTSMISQVPMNKQPSSATSHPAYSGQAQSLNPLASNPTDAPVPDRKRYRNKDPYAIDLDDDEEDVSALPRGKRGGESLAEFLRRSGPATDGEKPIASAASIAQARELRERARANVVNGNRRDSYYNANATSGAEDTALPNVSTSKLTNGMEARPPTAGRAGDRLGMGSSSNTKDLADFLRSSGPAPAPAVSRGNRTQQPVAPELKEKKSKGFFSFLRRPSTKGKSR